MIRALFGGSFDPFHAGHLAIVQTILSRGLAREVLLVPAGHNPHKPPSLTPARHRLRMTELGAAGLARVRVLDCEARRQGPSYTVDTLTDLVRRERATRWRLVIGADNLPEFHRWREPARLLALAELLVFPRGVGPVAVPEELAARAVVVSDFAVPVSSTAVRSALAAGGRPEDLVPPAVLDYIAAHGLYRAKGTGGAPAPGREGAPCP